MFDFNTILKIVQGAADAVPTLGALVEEVIATFGEEDQAKLKAAYADARKASDTAHVVLQDKLADAAKR